MKSPIVFFALLLVELPLVYLATRKTRSASIARVAIFAVPLALTLAARAYTAFSTRDVLEWDETYYLSMAVTAADGRGLYPYVFGYGQMPIMGGLGYFGYLYALAVKLAGPSIFALRTVSLLWSAVALVALWALVRALYGSGTAWIAATLVPALRLFILSNSARMDTLTFAWVTIALLLAVVAFRRGEGNRWHLLAGLAFGLGLQAHIDTVVTAFACGLMYVFRWVLEVRRVRRFLLPSSMLLYICGWGLGLALFAWLNILPDRDAFYRTTVLVRVDATSWYSSGTSSLFGSFLNPRILLAKESERYGVLFRGLHTAEISLILAGIGALLLRRGRIDVLVSIAVAGVLIAAAVVLNNASPLYFVHVTPALLVPSAALLSHGWQKQGKVATRDLSAATLVVFALVISTLVSVNTAKTLRPDADDRAQATPAAFAADVHARVSRQCRIVGDASLYVAHFADYPFFISARPTEVKYAMLFYGLDSETDYWEIKAPGAIAMQGRVPEALRTYVERHRLVEAGTGIWIAPGQCGNAS